MLFVGHAMDDAVVAVVSGNGDIVELRIADAALRRSHPHAIGPAVVAALTQARGAAGRTTRERLHATLRSAAEEPAPTTPTVPEPPRTRRTAPERPRRPRPVDDEPVDDEPDLFTGLWGGGHR